MGFDWVRLEFKCGTSGTSAFRAAEQGHEDGILRPERSDALRLLEKKRLAALKKETDAYLDWADAADQLAREIGGPLGTALWPLRRLRRARGTHEAGGVEPELYGNEAMTTTQRLQALASTLMASPPPTRRAPGRGQVREHPRRRRTGRGRWLPVWDRGRYEGAAAGGTPGPWRGCCPTEGRYAGGSGALNCGGSCSRRSGPASPRRTLKEDAAEDRGGDRRGEGQAPASWNEAQDSSRQGDG